MLRSFQELDDDADGYISKKDMEKTLKTMGEGLSDEELQYFFKLAIDPDGDPEKINIQRITEILLPKMESTNMLAQRNMADTSKDEGEAVEDAGDQPAEQ